MTFFVLLVLLICLPASVFIHQFTFFTYTLLYSYHTFFDKKTNILFYLFFKNSLAFVCLLVYLFTCLLVYPSIIIFYSLNYLSICIIYIVLYIFIIKVYKRIFLMSVLFHSINQYIWLPFYLPIQLHFNTFNYLLIIDLMTYHSINLLLMQIK